MTIKINAQGKERKRLVQVISKQLALDAEYCGAPTFNYKVGSIIIDKTGSLHLDGREDSEVIETLLEHIYDEGFDLDQSHTENEDEPQGIAIQIPMTDFTEQSLQNLFDLVEAKGALIKKALGIDDLPINLIGDRLDFPWFSKNDTPEEVKAYMDFVTALCNLANKQRRINKTDKVVTNEKYAFRCFLLRLGFIGDQYKTQRKILLRNFTGSSAFKEVKKDA